MNCTYQQIKFSDDDVIDYPDAWEPEGEYNPHRVRPFLLHDHGFVVAVVFAEHEQDALDAAVDADKMDRYLVAPENMGDYPGEEGLSFLGNAGEPFDIETLGVIELPNPRMATFCEQFAAQFPQA